MPSELLWWCGPCWIEGQRVLAVKKVEKLPLCKKCLKQYGNKPAEISRLFAIWNTMPDFDGGPSAQAAFENVLKATLK
jgi:hypothetical protein